MTANKFVVAITGPTGSGKSAVAKRLAKQIPDCANIEVDNIKHFLVSGFKYDILPDGKKKWRFEQ
ncbi:(d)CMP kinase [Candidatus Saccharibacteria bacterium]|nr:(d)CMP kinase [Candidatus Saccharibacteria bacterium]